MLNQSAAALRALAHIAKLAQGLAVWANAPTCRIRGTKVCASRESCGHPVAQGTAQPGRGINSTKENRTNTLIDVAVADGHFKTLAKALTAAGLARPWAWRHCLASLPTPPMTS